MNHFLLPSDVNGGGENSRYGVNLMEQLINELLKLGAAKTSMVAKVFGGANVAVGGSTVGARNGEFVKAFLECEGIQCMAASLGGERARRIRFWPASGRASQLLLNPADVGNEIAPVRPIIASDTSSVEPEIWD